MERDAVIVVAAVIRESKLAGPLASGTPLSGTGHCFHPKISTENQTTNQPYMTGYDLDII